MAARPVAGASVGVVLVVEIALVAPPLAGAFVFADAVAKSLLGSTGASVFDALEVGVETSAFD